MNVRRLVIPLALVIVLALVVTTVVALAQSGPSATPGKPGCGMRSGAGCGMGAGGGCGMRSGGGMGIDSVTRYAAAESDSAWIRAMAARVAAP